MTASEQAIDVRQETPHCSEAIALFAELWAELGAMYGDTGPCRFTPAQVDHANGAFVIAWIGGEVAGCGAMRPLEPGVAELKRMYVRPQFRRRGVARAILGVLEACAVELSYNAVRLETGVVQPAAIALYQSAGYMPIPAYGEFADDPLSRCFGKRLL
jgi:putative acetyltransferase